MLLNLIKSKSLAADSIHLALLNHKSRIHGWSDLHVACSGFHNPPNMTLFQNWSIMYT